MSSQISREWRRTTLEDLEEAHRQADFLRQRFGASAAAACSVALKSTLDGEIKFKLHLVLRELRRSEARDAMNREAAIALKHRRS